jgi:hypothetical protein
MKKNSNNFMRFKSKINPMQNELKLMIAKELGISSEDIIDAELIPRRAKQQVVGYIEVVDYHYLEQYSINIVDDDAEGNFVRYFKSLEDAESEFEKLAESGSLILMSQNMKKYGF